MNSQQSSTNLKNQYKGSTSSSKKSFQLQENSESETSTSDKENAYINAEKSKMIPSLLLSKVSDLQNESEFQLRILQLEKKFNPIAEISFDIEKSCLALSNWHNFCLLPVKNFPNYLQAQIIIFIDWIMSEEKHNKMKFSAILMSSMMEDSLEETNHKLKKYFHHAVAAYFYRNITFHKKIRMISTETALKLVRSKMSDSPMKKRIKDTLYELMTEFFKEENFIISIVGSQLNDDEKAFILKFHGYIRAEILFEVKNDWFHEYKTQGLILS